MIDHKQSIRDTLKAGLTFLLFVMFCSCRSEFPDIEPPSTDIKDGMSVSGSIAIPDMPVAETRGSFGDKPNNGLKLTVLEFDLAATAAQSFITNVYQAELKTASGVDNDGIVTFNLTLKAAATPKVLHFMIADDFVTVPADGGSVASLLPSLSVGNETSHPEAYWGYIEFPDGFSKVNADNSISLRDDVATKLTNIPVIRNFAKITVTNNSTANFELLGFDVVSCPTSGTIAPWNSSKQEIPSMIAKSGDANAMKSYSEISASSDPAIDGLPYSGILPDNVGFYNQEAQAKNWVDGVSPNMRSGGARYLYEHPYEPTRRTYVIINGNYTVTNEDNSTTTTRGFYKIDIGNIKGDGTFDYYNIIRNINYNIVINHVYAPGTETVAQAIERAPFNNLLASTETASMLNVSDGNNMLIVNDVNHVIVSEGSEVKILYRYITKVTEGQIPDNSIPSYIVGEGDVIKKNAAGDYEITKGTYTEPAPSNTEWVELTIKTNDPDEYQTKEQTVTIVDKKGLGRTITLILHKPWKYDIIEGTNYTATVRTGAYNYYGNEIKPTTTPPYVSNAAGKEFTVYFDLPDGLPDSIFPLDFTIEAKYQGIENNKKGTMLVTSGTSLFDPNVTAIQYIKSVSLNEYKYQYNGTEDSSGFNTGKANTNHTIRCRFTTISAVDNGSDGVIRIYNEYFVNPNYTTADDTTTDPKKSQCAEVEFKRMTNTGSN